METNPSHTFASHFPLSNVIPNHVIYYYLEHCHHLYGQNIASHPYPPISPLKLIMTSSLKSTTHVSATHTFTTSSLNYFSLESLLTRFIMIDPNYESVATKSLKTLDTSPLNILSIK